MMELSFSLNGIKKQIIVERDKKLIDVIRDNFSLKGTKRGGNKGVCGCCSVILNGKVVRSCRTPMEKIKEGSEIITIEGLGTIENPHPIQQAYVHSGAIQCGFCIPGMIVRTKALLDKTPNPTTEEIKKAFQGYLCRCTGYKKIIDAVNLSGKILQGELTVENLVSDNTKGLIGVSVHRPDALEKATGLAQYLDDIPFPDAVQLKVIRSQHSHALIKSIDASEAEKMPGIVGIVLANNIKGTNRVKEQLGQIKEVIEDWPILCEDTVRMIGDPVAVIGAETEEQALAAARKVKVIYEILPGVFSADEAMRQGVQQVQKGSSNLFYSGSINKGKAEETLKDSDVIVQGDFSTSYLAHAHLEPDGALAFFDEIGRLVIYGRSCGIHKHVESLGIALGVPADKIKYVQLTSGGHFGAKLEITAEGLAGAAALEFNRPVKLVYSMEETFMCNTKRHPFHMKAALGANKEGEIKAISAEIVVEKGAYNSASGKPTLGRALQHINGVYRIPNVKGTGKVVFTNNATGGAMRGPGCVQINFMIESIIDILAYEVGVDPFEIRILNAMKEGDITATGQRISEVPYIECLNKIRPYYDRAKMEARKSSTQSIKRGVGIAGVAYGIGYSSVPGDRSEVWAELMPDGSLTIYAGVADHGQGDDIMLIQMAAQAMGISTNKVHLVSRDSSLTPVSGASTASRQTYLSGHATLRAIEALKHAMKENDAYSYDDLVMKGLPVKYTGIKIQDTTATHPETLQGNPYETWGVGVEMAEVEVQINKGIVKILKMTAVGDPGTVINPQAVEGQFEGGMVMGAGMALYEEYVHGSTTNFNKYRIPGFREYFDMDVILNQTYRKKGPFGATGVGEFVTVPAAPAITNAIFDACGVRVCSLPITKEKFRKALDKQ